MLNCYLKKSSIGFLLLLASLQVVRAQQPVQADVSTITKETQDNYTITVVDEFGKALKGAVISAGGKQIIVTNEQGQAQVASRSKNEKIVITYQGYYSKTVTIKRNAVVQLVNNYLAYKDVNDVLYDQKDSKEILGAVSIVNNNQIKTTPTPLYLNALTGRLPGFYTQEISGFRMARTTPVTVNDFGSRPNSATTYSSNLSDNTEVSYNLRGQQPVTIIDGVQRDIYSIDPESIESVAVLKDALSTLLLGQKSSRGVLQVTTKKGLIGPPRISFTAQTGVQHSLKTPNPLSSYQYAYLYNEALQNSDRAAAFSEADFKAYRAGSSSVLYPDVNWYNQILKDNAPIKKYNLGVTGGTKNARYALDVSFLNQKGMFQSSDAFDYSTNLEQNRYLINSSIDVDVTKNFTLGLQLFGRIQDGRQPGAGTTNILNGLYSTPNNAYPVYNLDNSYGGSSIYTTNLYQQTTGSGYLLDNTRDLMANVDLGYKLDALLPGLYAKGKINVSSNSSGLIDRNRQQPVYDVLLNPAGETVYSRFGNISDQPNTFAATSTANFFYAQGAVGYESKNENVHHYGGKLFFDQQIANYQYDLPAKYTNIAATGNYNYQKKYFAEAAINYAGFNRFQPGHQFGLFYAGGVGWDISAESFIKDELNWIDQLKLRATYGKTGNTNEGALGYYSWRAAYDQDGINGYVLGSQYAFLSGLVERGLANVNATWEKAHKLNIGLDMAFFNSHLKVVADYYHDTYYDLLQQRGSSIELIGLAYPNENIGRNLFTGQELSITYQNKLGSFNYFITANGSRMQTKVLYMNEIQQKYPWNFRTGMPVGQTFGYLADGLIQTQAEADKAPRLAATQVYPGDVKLVDLNGDGVIDMYDQTAIGNTKPVIYYGATVGFNFKGFDFSILLQGVKNRTYQQTDYAFGSTGDRQGYDYLIGRWTPETAQTATYPRLTLGFNANNTPYLNDSSFWTRSGEYFRVRNIDVGYSFPFKIISKLKISGLRIFANAQNLFTSTPYTRLDPEIYGNAAYPAQRILNAGVNIKL